MYNVVHRLENSESEPESRLENSEPWIKNLEPEPGFKP
jgi:hypothetical protein